MRELSTEELETIDGARDNTLRALGLATTLLANEKLDELPMPRFLDPNPIVQIIKPIEPPPLPGGATIKRDNG